MTRQTEREDLSRARNRTTRVAGRCPPRGGSRPGPAGPRRLGRHRARPLGPRRVQQQSADPRHPPRRLPGPRPRRRARRGQRQPGRRRCGLAGPGARRRRPRGGRQQPVPVGRPRPLPLRWRRHPRHRRGRQQRPSRLPGGDVWQQTSTGTGAAHLVVQPSDVPQSVVATSGNAAALGRVRTTLTWQHQTWFLEALAAAALGLVLAAPALGFLWRARRRRATREVRHSASRRPVPRE